jgi:A/G-specific adenine glycosylase
MSNLTGRDVIEIQSRLLKWFRVSGRQFPWRQTRDPYAILLAEKLLQQTAVRESVVQAYHDLLASYPTPAALAQADLDNIRPMIQPLGLHYRSQELVTLAEAIAERHGGYIPKDLKSLLALPGVGDYTARAILCFALGQDVPVVDTNIARILYRLFGLPGPIPANPARKQSLIDLAGSLVPKGEARQLNWAMIDLGALICKVSKPHCGACPLQQLCTYYKQGGSFDDPS